MGLERKNLTKSMLRAGDRVNVTFSMYGYEVEWRDAQIFEVMPWGVMLEASTGGAWLPLHRKFITKILPVDTREWNRIQQNVRVSPPVPAEEELLTPGRPLGGTFTDVDTIEHDLPEVRITEGPAMSRLRERLAREAEGVGTPIRSNRTSAERVSIPIPTYRTSAELRNDARWARDPTYSPREASDD